MIQKSPEDLVLVTSEPIFLDPAIRALGHQATGEETPEDLEAGALVTFSGIVRETEGEAKIQKLDYDHYEGMAESEIGKLIGQAREKWPLRRVLVHHRVGGVGAGETSVIVAVSAGHRAEAFEAARFLIDELKKSVPIWKQAPGD